MAEVVISGVPPWDGEYDLNEDLPWNTREWRWVKLIAGVMPAGYEQAYEGRDADLFLAIAVIGLCRAGRIGKTEGPTVAAELEEVPWGDGKITIRGSEAADDIPLEPTTTPEPSSLNGSEEKPLSQSETPNGSGRSSTTVSGTSDASQRLTTLLRSGTS